MRTHFKTLSVLIIALLTAPASAQPCAYDWTKGWFGPPLPLDAPVWCVHELDGLWGKKLFIGGEFSFVDTAFAHRAALHDGVAWSAVGSAALFMCEQTLCEPTRIMAAEVFDDGTGPALYVGGRFTSVGGLTVNYVARWDGSAWTALGTGLQNSPAHNEVLDLLAFDDGSGAALYAAGRFKTAGGVAASNIAKWDGKAWWPLGAGLGDMKYEHVKTLAAYDDGTGAALYAGGGFQTSGDATMTNVAKWSAGRWNHVGLGFTGTTYYPYIPAGIDKLFASDASGRRRLYAGGFFSKADGKDARNVAAWDGVTWSPVGGGFGLSPGWEKWNTVFDFEAFDFGQGPRLVAAFAYGGAQGGKYDVLIFEDEQWKSIAGEAFYPNSALDLEAINEPDGPALYAVGSFKAIGGIPAQYVARWKGGGWQALPASNYPKSIHGPVYAAHVHDDGTGPALYVGGDFSLAAEPSVHGLARWDGSSWHALGIMPLVKHRFEALQTYDDGSGAALYCAAQSNASPGNGSVLKWNGSAWSVVGDKIGDIHAMTVFDGGAGARIFAARDAWYSMCLEWKGAGVWEPLPDPPIGHFSLRALRPFEFGGQAALYLGGGSSITPSSEGIHKWTGQTYAPFPSSISGMVHVMEVYDSGSGPALHVGGEFTKLAGLPLKNLARWNGLEWSSIGNANGPVFAMAVVKDGAADALFVGGGFTLVGGVHANGIARFDGTSWKPLGTGVSGEGAVVRAVAGFQDGENVSIYVGGSFATAGGGVSVNFARYAYESLSCPGDLDLNGVVDAKDLGILLADYGCTSGCVGDTDCDDDTDQGDLGALLKAFGMACEP